VAIWLYKDAKKKGFKTLTALGWALSVLLFMIVFLPLYFLGSL
jgi:hypothetical protein